MSARADFRGALLALILLAGAGRAPAFAQQRPPPVDGTPAIDPAVKQALQELREGKDVPANLARLKQFADRDGDASTGLARDVGTLLLREGNYAQAQTFLEIARAHLPQDGASAQLLGLAHVMQTHFAEGFEQLVAAEKLLPPGLHPLLHEYVSMALTGLQRMEEAEARAKRAIDEARQWNAALAAGQRAIDAFDLELNLVEVYHRSKRFDDALAVLDHLPVEKLAKNRLAKAWLVRAQLLVAKGDDAGAVAAFSKEVEIAPDEVEGRYQFALYYVTRGDPARARPLLEKAVALDPAHEGAHFNLARVLLRTGEKEAGERTMAEYQKLRANRLDGEIRLSLLRDELQKKSGKPGGQR